MLYIVKKKATHLCTELSSLCWLAFFLTFLHCRHLDCASTFKCHHDSAYSTNVNFPLECRHNLYCGLHLMHQHIQHCQNSTNFLGVLYAIIVIYVECNPLDSFRLSIGQFLLFHVSLVYLFSMQIPQDQDFNVGPIQLLPVSK